MNIKDILFSKRETTEAGTNTKSVIKHYRISDDGLKRLKEIDWKEVFDYTDLDFLCIGEIEKDINFLEGISATLNDSVRIEQLIRRMRAWQFQIEIRHYIEVIEEEVE